MEVILLERIGRLGNTGDVVRVKDGFARNFLIPLKKALRASNENKQVFEAKRAEIEARNAEAKSAAEAVAKKMEGVAITLVRQASEEGKLFGSVTVRDVSEALEAKGFKVAKSQILIAQTIKTTGAYTVKATLHSDVVVPVTVNVIKNEQD
jgi:large subunit ribosomal protein L9